MLVLSRKKDESIVIGDSVVVHVQAIRGNRVLIAIDAPPEVKVVRGELRPICHRCHKLMVKQDGRNGMQCWECPGCKRTMLVGHRSSKRRQQGGTVCRTK